MAAWSGRVRRGVIDDARERHGQERRRLLAALLLIVVAAVAIAVAVSGASGPGRTKTTFSGAHSLARGPALRVDVQTPQGVVEIGLRRTRFLGKPSLCLDDFAAPGLRSVTPETCASYPVGPSSGQGIAHAHLLLGAVFSGLCPSQQFTLYAAVILRHGLTAWLQSTDLRITPMRATALPVTLGVTGPLVYAVVRIWQPYRILLRDHSGRTISEANVLKLGRGFCKA